MSLPEYLIRECRKCKERKAPYDFPKVGLQCKECLKKRVDECNKTHWQTMIKKNYLPVADPFKGKR